MPEIAIQVEHLHKSYRRGIPGRRKPVLQDVTFCVPKGCVFGFLGPNGAGKSTTIKVLLDFVQPDQGSVQVLGQPPRHAASRRRIGYLPETADYYSFLTPRKLLALYCDLFGMSGADAHRRVAHLLDLVGLSREKDERIGLFSKGMKQRVGIAQAMLNSPELLILDEPTSGLDPIGMREIRDLILAQKHAGSTVFFSSHDLGEVEAVCDEAAIIRTGRILRHGKLDELVPYREELMVRVTGIDAAQLEKLPIVREVRPPIHPQEIVFIANPGLTMEDILRHIAQTPARVLSVAAVRDSLEDIFVQLMKEEI